MPRRRRRRRRAREPTNVGPGRRRKSGLLPLLLRTASNVPLLIRRVHRLFNGSPEALNGRSFLTHERSSMANAASEEGAPRRGREHLLHARSAPAQPPLLRLLRCGPGPRPRKRKSRGLVHRLREAHRLIPPSAPLRGLTGCADWQSRKTPSETGIPDAVGGAGRRPFHALSEPVVGRSHSSKPAGSSSASNNHSCDLASSLPERDRYSEPPTLRRSIAF